MASSFLRPCRRFLHSSTSTRIISSASRSNNTQWHPPPSQPHPNTKDMGNELTKFLDRVSSTHNYEQMKSKQLAARFPLPDREDTPIIIRPINFNKKFALSRPQNRRRPPLGPGRKARYDDVFLQLGIDPRREADNKSLLSSYLSRLGRIKPRNVTELSQRSQRLLGKAIKRARMMGVIPAFHDTRPELTVRPSRASPTVDHKDRSPDLPGSE